jgi:hypothetical protein
VAVALGDGYLTKNTLTGAIPQPGITRKPSDATQYQLARTNPNDSPPVNERTWCCGCGSASSEVFTHQTSKDKARNPPRSSAVPTDLSADSFQIADEQVFDA